jgi:phage-related protein (TIGR01555 family)
MLNWFREIFGVGEPLTETEEPDEVPAKRTGMFSSTWVPRSRKELESLLVKNIFQKTPDDMLIVTSAADAAMDDATDLKAAYRFTSMNITDTQLSYYGSQGFIGFQLMAVLAQNWLINKALQQPAKDAIRNGFEVSVPEGVTVPPEVLAFIKECDKRRNLTKNLMNFVYFGRMFGIRVVKFDVDSTDPEYYEKPFNPDGVTPGSYKGMVQIDPYWMAPILDGRAAANPDSKHFYEPTYWQINGRKFHRSHLIIFLGPEMPDVLKPTYQYAGLSTTQAIFERVYAAERTANEAPMLAQSKRETVIHVDMELATANPQAFEQKMGVWADYRNNWGVKVVGTEEEIEQFDTSLADFDSVIMTQYQLVASIAGVPVTKLLGTVPKGFNATGEYDESSYHEELESIQTHDLERLITRHHLLTVRSDVAAKFPNQPRFDLTVTWNALDALTAAEQADINKIKAETGQILMQSGAIDGEDERARLVADKDSGYISLPDPVDELIEGDDLETSAQ